MPKNPIVYYNRYSKRLEEEKIFGENWLRFIYENPLGKVALHTFIKRKLFSKWYGMMASQASSRRKIIKFVEKYNINTAEFSDREHPFRNFNEFFSRKLNREARPIAGNPDKVVFPADGRHLVLPNIGAADKIFVKGQRFDLRKLLGSQQLAEKYNAGSLLISRLCPTDYHRFHFPFAGVPSPSKRIRGPLFSVSPIALKQQIDYLWTNERQICELRTRNIGSVLIVEIGATCVGTIEQTYQPEMRVAKGSEKGCFHFGGSCVVTIFEPETVRFADDLITNSRDGTETYARMGDTIGVVC